MNCLNCTTRHLQTSGRLVQILIACIVQPGTGIPPVDWCTNSIFVLYNQALADVRSTGADINCVYCTTRYLQTSVRLVQESNIRLYNQALADVRSTSAGIRCLYCTTRHWQTSDRLVQEFNVCTVRFSMNNWNNWNRG